MNLSKKFKNKSSQAKEWFASLGVLGQLGVVISLGFSVVMSSGILMGSIENTYLVFIDPPALPVMKDEGIKLYISFLLMLFGMVVTSFNISVLSAALEKTFRDIRKGHLKYYGENHTLIINYNRKVMKILQEINLLHEKNKDIHDIIIFMNNEHDIENLQTQIKKYHFNSLKIFIRFGDTFLYSRYRELGIYDIYSLVILSDENIKDPFLRDNNNLRIMNLLFSDDKFSSYLAEKKRNMKQVKAVVEFSDIHHFDTIVQEATQSLFLALSPTNVLSSILNLSMININFYNTWSQLLSFDGYELYFVDAKKYNLCETNYQDALLRHKQGLLIGISRVENGEFKLLLNAHNETIKENDWLIFISEDIHSIDFLDKVQEYKATQTIEAPKEIFTRNIAIIGEQRDIQTNELLDKHTSFVANINYDKFELFEKESYDKLLTPLDEKDIKYDTIIINHTDEMIYRIALNLKVLYSSEYIEKFVFIVDDALIAEQLIKTGFKNTILSHLLISNYMAQVSNQLALHKVFNILLTSTGAQLNFIDTYNIPQNIQELKYELIHNKMLYLGLIMNDGRVEFESKNIQNAKKVIVLSDGKNK